MVIPFFHKTNDNKIIKTALEIADAMRANRENIVAIEYNNSEAKVVKLNKIKNS